MHNQRARHPTADECAGRFLAKIRFEGESAEGSVEVEGVDFGGGGGVDDNPTCGSERRECQLDLAFLSS